MRWSALIMLFVLLGCTEVITQEEMTRRAESKFEIIVLDGCEYYNRHNGGNYNGQLAHKGNCKNCLKRDTCR